MTQWPMKRKSKGKGKKAHKRRQSQRNQRSQKGGAYGFTGPAFQPVNGMAPIEARSIYPDGEELVRPAPGIQGGGGCSSCSSTVHMLRGGGSGGGGYSFDLHNHPLGKEPVVVPGSCPQLLRGGGSSSSPLDLVSYNAGFGYNPSSAVEVGKGTAHYLEPVSYGASCMGGGGRSRLRSRRNKRNNRSTRKQRSRR